MKRVVATVMIFSVITVGQLSADQTVDAEGKEGVEAMFRAEAPYIAKARATYQQAKKRYLAGLPAGYSFIVRKHLIEPGTHKSEGVLIEVDSIKNGKIYGQLGDVELPSFHRGQRFSLAESELEDWAILHPDGSVEGDFIGKYLQKAKSVYTNDLALSSDDIANIKRVCHQLIGFPFQDASLWMQLSPFIRAESELYQPMTTCGGDYCSGQLPLRDDAQVLYTYLHITPVGSKPDEVDITPDLGRKGNNRIVGVSLTRHGATLFYEGHLDQPTMLYLRYHDSPKSK
jgi:hypothetical protein